MATALPFDPNAWNSQNSTVAAPYTLGQVVESNGFYYRYFKNAADGAWANGQVLVMASVSVYTVTYTKGASQLSAKLCVGVAPSALAVSCYGWALVQGIHAAVLDSGNGCTLGKWLTGLTGAGNGDAANAIAGEPGFGLCLASGSGGLTKVEVRCL